MPILPFPGRTDINCMITADPGVQIYLLFYNFCKQYDSILKGSINLEDLSICTRSFMKNAPINILAGYIP